MLRWIQGWRSRGLVPTVLLVLSAPVGVLAEAPAVANSVAQAAVSPPEESVAPEQVARNTVESFHAVLLEVMKSSGAASFAERQERVAEALDGSFDMILMAKTSIGKSWKALGEQQQRDWVALSRTYSASNYAKNFKDWSGQSFATLGVEPAARGTLVVKTELVQPTDDNVKFDYRLRKLNGGWRVIDVQLDGKVSEITLRRADYRSVIERKGFEQLVADVTRKIAGFERQ